MLNINDFANRQTSDQEPYDQYEVSVPLQSAGTCLKQARMRWGLNIKVKTCFSTIIYRINTRCPCAAAERWRLPQAGAHVMAL